MRQLDQTERTNRVSGESPPRRLATNTYDDQIPPTQGDYRTQYANGMDPRLDMDEEEVDHLVNGDGRYQRQDMKCL